MKFISLLIFVFVGLVLGVKAQTCGGYITTLVIKDKLNKPITDAEVTIVPFPVYNYTHGKGFIRDENNASRFLIIIPEHDIVKGKYKVTVRAKGYFPAEKQIEFPWCGQQEFEFKLSKKLVKRKK